jgi:hypothetical protein
VVQNKKLQFILTHPVNLWKTQQNIENSTKLDPESNRQQSQNSVKSKRQILERQNDTCKKEKTPNGKHKQSGICHYSQRPNPTTNPEIWRRPTLNWHSGKPEQLPKRTLIIRSDEMQQKKFAKWRTVNFWCDFLGAINWSWRGRVGVQLRAVPVLRLLFVVNVRGFCFWLKRVS